MLAAAALPILTLPTQIDFFKDLKGSKYNREQTQAIIEIAEGLDGRFHPYATRSEKLAAEKKVEDARIAEEKRVQAEKEAAAKAEADRLAAEKAARIAAQEAAAAAERQRLVNEANAQAEASRQARSQPPARSQARGPSSGNTYEYGYCTWYVKKKRPDLPNNLGDAHTWAVRAASQGIPTGYQARSGAVGVSTKGPLGHVIYVESVNGNGTMNISEMNYAGWNKVSYRTISTEGWRFIY